ncbi:ATP-binding protein [Globicatella sanguinis]|uniref:ATP-binding protein n=1 Tax=Globicatella sanguinis TaxID=13076 RepID=UPI002543F3B2|nr:ATP-binding protein [Globicatella sanguinis]MDK7631748.1 ATP-binding protein [Globicatella sanguinis]WIK65512.1 ATP-binding protein [Globicatella sanguinis]WIK66146.1 ATP-binding protein [Globicatella sanguinis]WIK66431.1 ATP-binding protein [Globicatella sanguinis]WIK66782.1 ATP-binding protein [Globicatella sanguinis]
MINSESIRKLRQLDLEPLVSALEMQELENDSLTLTFDERLQLAIDYLYQEKYNKKVHGLIKRANFRLPEADVTSIYYEKRELKQQVIQELARGNYLHRYRNVVFQGFTGSGKTYLACALGKEACKLEVRTRYIRLPDLLVERDEATLKPSGMKKLITKYSNYGLLILDEWLLEDLSDEDLKFIFEITEKRYQSGSTIFCTQFRKSDWHQRLGGGVHADAIMDRIVHNSVWLDAGQLNMREHFANQE